MYLPCLQYLLVEVPSIQPHSDPQSQLFLQLVQSEQQPKLFL